MFPKRQKPQPTLQVPVPNFPLSSPISEEISSPSSSSIEDHDEERNRPFAFLNKATRQRLEGKTSQNGNRSPISAHREPSRLNVRGITKKRKSVARTVGLNLVTDFTLAPAPARKATVTENKHAIAPFVDLNDLKLLSKVRERERSTRKSKDIFKKRDSRGFQRMQDDESVQGQQSRSRNETSFLNLGPEDPFHDRHEHGISPSDRHVMIGLTVPRNESIERSRDPDSAGTPLTPTIIVTPAREDAPWNPLSNSRTELLRPRVASSVYSQPTPRLWQYESDVPPVPAIPSQHTTAKESTSAGSEYPDTLGVERNARALSTSTWEDDSPPATPASLHPTEHKKGRLSVITTASTDRPGSQGWWTYLLSPLLNRSIKSPLSPSFPTDSPVTPSTTTTTRVPPKQWMEREKEISCFSPDTPETAAPMDEKAFELSRSFNTDDYQHGNERQQSPPPAYVSNVPSRQNSMSVMFGNQTIQGEAAEYYQACAHELFSRTPYFECFNHVCSITPAHAAPITLNGTVEGNSSRGVGVVAIDEGKQGHGDPASVAGSTRSTKNAGLLIDLNSPRPESSAATIPAGYAVRAKEVQVQSPVSDTSIDSWDCSDVDEHEKGSVAPPAAKKGAENTRSQPTSAASAPVPVAVETTDKQDEDRGASAPVAIPMPEPLPTPAPAPASAPSPAPISAPPPQIITNISPPVTNVHYPAPPPQQQAQPLQPTIQYVPIFAQAGQPVQTMVQEPQPQVQDASRGIPDAPATQPRVLSPKSEWPWGEQDQSQVQSQVQPPAPQEQATGFEWAYSQKEQPQEPLTTRASPQQSQVASRQPSVLRRQPTRGHAVQPRGLPILQGRLSGSGWPFGIHAHPHSHAPPVAPVSQDAPTGPESESQQDQRGSDESHTERGLPQGSELAPQENSQAPEPISPGFQRAAGGSGSIPLSDMQAPAPAYTQYPRDAPLPPRYDLRPRYEHNPEAGVSIVNPSGAIGPYEARRRRLEREEATGRRLCGLWRGRGPFSKKNGRPGREGRIRRRWYFVICFFFLMIVIVATVLAITLTRKDAATPVQSQWLNLTGYPPMPTGIATLAGTQPQTEKSTCVTPSSMWSCALPKEQQEANEPYNANQPNFRVSIQFRNGTYKNSTAVGSNATSNLHTRNDDLFDPSPAAPRDAEQAFLGQYTDKNSAPYAGEETPFYMSLLSPISLSSASIYRRSDTGTSNGTIYPNITSIIPPPDTNADGTAAAAKLYPLPSSQPIRLYNRNLPTEHYGFYTYFDKSIFLTSQRQPSDADTNGGVSKSTAHYRCTWSQTRFLVQIWTQPDKMGLQLLSPSPDTTATAATSTSTNETPKSSSSATDFSRPGSFPYPVTVTIDRHGGAEKKKMVYCYPLESDGHYNITGAQLQLEDRGIGGELVNPASGLFKGLSGTRKGDADGFGGVDGGSGGCGCQWVNWIERK